MKEIVGAKDKEKQRQEKQAKCEIRALRGQISPLKVKKHNSPRDFEKNSWYARHFL